MRGQILYRSRVHSSIRNSLEGQALQPGRVSVVFVNTKAKTANVTAWLDKQTSQYTIILWWERCLQKHMASGTCYHLPWADSKIMLATIRRWQTALHRALDISVYAYIVTKPNCKGKWISMAIRIVSVVSLFSEWNCWSWHRLLQRILRPLVLLKLAAPCPALSSVWALVCPVAEALGLFWKCAPCFSTQIEAQPGTEH